MLLPAPDSPLTRMSCNAALVLEAVAHELLARVALEALGARLLVAGGHLLLLRRLALGLLVAPGHALLLRSLALRLRALAGEALAHELLACLARHAFGLLVA